MMKLFANSGPVRRVIRWRHTMLLIAPALYLLLGVLAVAETFRPVARRPDEAAAVQDKDAGRQREGTSLVDSVGSFKISGDRATFYGEDGRTRLVGLENMNLERVTATITENPDQLTWSVSGMVTEYRGANYLLISRAILKSKPDKPGARPKSAKPAATDDKAT
jgi:hypothetical protein